MRCGIFFRRPWTFSPVVTLTDPGLFLLLFQCSFSSGVHCSSRCSFGLTVIRKKNTAQGITELRTGQDRTGSTVQCSAAHSSGQCWTEDIKDSVTLCSEEQCVTHHSAGLSFISLVHINLRSFEKFKTSFLLKKKLFFLPI
jgi:hypothetical protein